MKNLNPDTSATVFGTGAGMMLIASVDWNGVTLLHWGEIAKILAGLFIVALAVVTNKKVE